LLLVASIPAVASSEDEPSSPPAASAPAAGARLATKSEYLACLVAKSALETKKDQLMEGDRRQQEQTAKFQKAEADLNAQVKKHTPTTKREIESYNRAIDARNKSADALNTSATSLQQEFAAFNKQVVETNARCGSLLVMPDVAQEAQEEHKRMTGAK
jgi:predicted  nucleic acid-binding Zn-ribbon protein